MKQIIIIFVCLLSIMAAYAKPHCQGFNNYDNKVTIVFTEDNVGERMQAAEVARGRNGFFLRCAPVSTSGRFACEESGRADNRKDKAGEPSARCNLIATKARRERRPRSSGEV